MADQTVIDLRSERSNPPFVVDELTHFYDGGPQATKKRKFISSLIINNPVFKSLERHYWTREESYNSNMQCLAEVPKIIKQHNINVDNFMEYHWLVSTAGETMPFELHLSMWKSSIINQGTLEQQRKWVPLTDNFKILSTYCQTELGHGTFVRGLETTATFDVKKKEFILNTPTLTATKWWPGALARTVTHALVMAQLWIRNRCYGPHLFILQVRSLDDHRPMPGITVGDIGSKIGYNSIDNGFMRMNNVRIPLDQMLMKHSKVTEDGTYIPPKNPKLAYGAMTLYRSQMLIITASYLARASTIAVRYSAVRRQTEIKPGYEPKILDYTTQQDKLFPHIAETYALVCVGHYMLDFSRRASELLKNKNLSILAEFHGVSAGLKAYATEISIDGLEECRRACGGHGYSSACGIGHIYNNWLASCTYEGENTVMYLQSARYLISCIRNPKSAPLSVSAVLRKTTSKTWNVKNLQDLEQANTLLEAYRTRAYNKLVTVERYISELEASGDDKHTAWNKSGIKLVDAAKAFAHYFIVNAFFDTIKKSSLSQSCRLQLYRLAVLLALKGIDRNSGDFLQDEFINFDHLKLVRDRILELYGEIRPVAVCLVDAFDISDFTLSSVLGRYDGNVYSKLFEWAKETPLNKTEVHSSYHKYLRGLITSKL